MALIGISLIVASVIYLFVRPPPWLATYLTSWRQLRIEGPAPPQTRAPREYDTSNQAHDKKGERTKEHLNGVASKSAAIRDRSPNPSDAPNGQTSPKDLQDRIAMPPPAPRISTSGVAKENPLPPSIAAPTSQTPTDHQARKAMPPPPPPPRITSPASDSDEPEQTTPKANPSTAPTPIPTLNLDTPNLAPPTRQTQAARAVTSTSSAPSSSSLMPSPTRPKPPTLNPIPTSSRLAPSPHIPARGPGTSTLAPPPTHTTIPTKSRAVTLAPGRSPLDWARISGPSCDLRNLPPSTPYLKVTRSQLKYQNGRKGRDAWMALNGKVYNVSPYREYHPGGVGELLRGAGKDGTKLFGEMHPWVNYETMLQACLVGILVEDHEVGGSMDGMD